jgi:hypothetical protein
MAVRGKDGKDVSAFMDLDQIAELMAILSHCQHVLVLSSAGREVNMPIDPNIAFQPEAGSQALGAYEGISRFAMGVDDLAGLVAFQFLSSSGRLSGYRIKPEKARALSRDLEAAADATPTPAMKQ